MYQWETENLNMKVYGAGKKIRPTYMGPLPMEGTCDERAMRAGFGGVENMYMGGPGESWCPTGHTLRSLVLALIFGQF